MGVENIAVEDGKIQCDVVIVNRGAAELGDEEIASILQQRVLKAVNTCVLAVAVAYYAQALTAALN